MMQSTLRTGQSILAESMVRSKGMRRLLDGNVGDITELW